MPQWPVVEPQYEYCEQHSPNEDPLQVVLPAPPQVPSVETFRAAAVAAALVGAAEEPHVPKPDWQPLPQWSEEAPLFLYWEQQFKKVEPKKVVLPAPPQAPSVEILEAAVAVGVAALVEEAAPLLPQLPKPDWQP